MRGVRSLTLGLSLLVCAAPIAFAAPPTTTPPLGIREKLPELVAFTGAHVVLAPGREVEDGVVVIRDGRVEAAGSGVRVPAGARVIEARGKWIYPGFVDPYTEYGLGHVGDLNPKPAGDGPQYEAERTGADAWNDAIHAERDWVAWFRPDAEAAKALLARGVTAVQSVRRDGIFRGRGFVASLEPDLANDVVLVSRGPHFAAFDKGSSSQAYPASLMGSIALVRQTLLDADWYARAAEAADAAAARLEVNRSVEALGGFRGPLVFETDDELSLLRASRVAREAGLSVIHVGSGREHRRLEEIAALDEPLILPLAFPEPPPVATVEDELDVTLADLRHWDRAPHNARLLAERGVRFAFTGHGLDEPRERFLDNLRRAITAGLPRDTALAALTTHAAALAGVDRLLGTLEPGKLGHVVIASGDLLADEDAMVEAVWIGSRRVHETRPLDATDFRGVYALALGGSTLELRVAGKRGEPRVELVAGEEKVSAGVVRSERERLWFTADLEELGVGQGIARFELRARESGFDGNAVLADGRREALGVRRTADEVPRREREQEDTAQAGEGSERNGDEGDDAKEEERKQADRRVVARRTSPDLAFGFEELPEREDVLVRGATIWTSGPEGVLENADLLVVGGKVAAVGRGLRAPRDARVIDGTGKHVTPGLIDEHSHLAISGGVNEGSHAITSEVRIGDVVDPDDVGIWRALAGGATTAQLLHGSANPIGGQAQVIKHRWGQDAEGLKLDAAPPTIKFALGENVKQSNWGDDHRTRYPQSRMGVESLMRDALVAAREYAEDHREWNALAARERARRLPPRRDLRLEALAEILERERFIHCHSYQQGEILALMRLAEELGFRVQTFTHVLEGYKVAPEMAAHGAGASSFSDWWAYKFEVYDAIPYNTCLLDAHGVVTSVNSDSAESIRRLNQEAAKSVMYCDMDESDALALATINPAIQLRIDDRVGSLEPGKDGDFVIWNAHPLSMLASVDETWIEGVPVFTRERDAAARERDRAERRALVQEVRAAGGGERRGGGERKRERPAEGWSCEDVADWWSDAW